MLDDRPAEVTRAWFALRRAHSLRHHRQKPLRILPCETFQPDGHTAGCIASRPILSKVAANSCRGAATFVNWNLTHLERHITCHSRGAETAPSPVNRIEPESGIAIPPKGAATEGTPAPENTVVFRNVRECV